MVFALVPVGVPATVRVAAAKLSPAGRSGRPSVPTGVSAYVTLPSPPAAAGRASETRTPVRYCCSATVPVNRKADGSATDRRNVSVAWSPSASVALSV